jgi:hypothetical protein
MSNGTTGMASTPAGGASATDINSTLKNIVINVGQEVLALGALSTTAASSFLMLQAINTTLQAIGTALATSHVFAGGFTMTVATTVTTVVDAHVTSNSRIVFAATNGTASGFIKGSGAFVGPPSSGQFLFTGGDVAAGTETFSYIVFTP